MTDPKSPKTTDRKSEDTPVSALAVGTPAKPAGSSSETEEEDTPTSNNNNNSKPAAEQVGHSTPLANSVPNHEKDDSSSLLHTLVAAATMSSEKADAIRSKSNNANSKPKETETETPHQQETPSPVAAAAKDKEPEVATKEPEAAKEPEEEKQETIKEAEKPEEAKKPEAAETEETAEGLDPKMEDAMMEDDMPIAELTASRRSSTRKRAPAPTADTPLAAEESKPSPPKRAARSKSKTPTKKATPTSSAEPASTSSKSASKKASSAKKASAAKKKPAGPPKLNSTVPLMDMFAYYTHLEKKEWMTEQELITKNLPASLRKRLVNFRTEGKISRESRLSHLNCLKANMLFCGLQSYGFTWNVFADQIPSYTEEALAFPKSTKRFRVLGKARDADRTFHSMFYNELQEFLESNYGMDDDAFGTLIQLAHLHHLLYYHVLDSTYFSVEDTESMDLNKAFGKFCYRAKSFFEQMKALFKSVEESGAANWKYETDFPAGNPSARPDQPDPGVGLKTPQYQTIQWVLFYCPYLLWDPNNLKRLDHLPDEWKGKQTEAQLRETFWKESIAPKEEDGKDRPKNKQQSDICTLGQSAYLGIPAFVTNWKNGNAQARNALKALFPKMKQLIEEFEAYLPVLSSTEETFLVYFQNEFYRRVGKSNPSESYASKLSRLEKQREVHAEAMAKIDEEIAALKDEEQKEEDEEAGGGGEDDNDNNGNDSNKPNGRKRTRRGGKSETETDDVTAVAV